MSMWADLSDKLDEKVLEDLTSNVKQIQDDVLKEILTLSANTEYLRPFLHKSSDKELFKKNVPVTTYDDVKLFIDLVANGEPFDVISGKPITGFSLSYFWRKTEDVSMHVDGLEHGKGMVFNVCVPEHTTTPSGLPVSAATTLFFKSDYFKNRPQYWHWSFTSPDEVILCSDSK
ncbi:hypothetical protein F2Q69_00001358 [Brassica cretica]|uniref:Uncharacterized protein n=1 Tax=Brassica cretica TaxID=69181 RepID=A0A8S9PG08_BRACR|nr:hypothetical protein F2Q69_00001358 [Brassica cretica]